MFILALIPTSSANWFVANVHTDLDCSKKISEVIIPTGACIDDVDQIPLPDGKSVPFRSASFECTQSKDGSVQLNAKTYLKSLCGGFAINVPYVVDAGCNMGTIVTCDDIGRSEAFTNDWPSVATYQKNECNETPLAVASFVANKCISASFDKASGSEIVRMQETSLKTTLFNSLDCSGPVNTTVLFPKYGNTMIDITVNTS